MSNKDALEELRELKTEIRVKQVQGRALRDMIKNHPAKPPAGTGGERAAKWALIKDPLEQQRLDLAHDVRQLQAELKQVRDGLNQSPLEGRTISDVIDKLVVIESLFTVDGHAAAWDSLTSLTDWLEELEAAA